MPFSISPMSTQTLAIAIIIVFVIDVILYNIKSNIIKKVYKIYTSTFIALGVFGLFFIRSLLKEDLAQRLNSNMHFDEHFAQWALKKYDNYIIISTVILIIAIFTLVLFIKRKNKWIKDNFGKIMILISIVFMIFNVWYSLGTINKIFDFGSYFGMLLVSNIFILHIPILINIDHSYD